MLVAMAKSRLIRPIAGVELQEGMTILDGAPVFPIASPGPKSGFVVGLEGKGSHRLELSFYRASRSKRGFIKNCVSLVPGFVGTCSNGAWPGRREACNWSAVWERIR